MMTRNAKSNKVGGFKTKSCVFSKRNNVVNVKFAATLTAVLASVIISSQCFATEVLVSRKVSNASRITFPVSMSETRSNAVRIIDLSNTFVPGDLAFFSLKPSGSEDRVVFQPCVDFRPIVVGFMPLLVTHFGNRGMVTFNQSFIPCRFIACLGSSALRMVSSDVFGIDNNPVSFCRASFCCSTTTAFTQLRFLHAVHYTGNLIESQEKLGELLETPCERTISIRAIKEFMEGSETNAYDPERVMKRHENPTRKGRYSPSLLVTARARKLKTLG